MTLVTINEAAIMVRDYHIRKGKPNVLDISVYLDTYNEMVSMMGFNGFMCHLFRIYPELNFYNFPESISA